jgi:hypothetical protein
MANQTEKRTVEIIMDGKQPSSTLKSLNADIKTLNRSIRDLPAGSKEFDVQAKKMRELKKEYQGFQQKVNFAGQSLQYFKSQLKAVAIGTIGGNLITGIGQAITSQISGSIKYMADLSDELANIRKTTGLSAQGVDELNRSLSKIDTRTSKKNLREIAVGLGQIGEKANIENIRAIDTVVVALGDEFGSSAQEITTAISILRNNLTDFKTGNYADDILKIGNALNVLGATGLATAPVVTDFATRMSGVLEGFNVTTGQILGVSAAMQELGISVERGSTAVTKLVQKMAQNPEVFAKVAGAKTKKEIKDFIDLLNKDAISALIKVAQGAKSAGNSNTQFASILKELESTGAGVGEVLSKFAANADLVTSRVNTTNESLKNANSINQEFALLNENNAAKLEKLKKAFTGLIDNQALNRFFTSAINGTISFIKWTKDASNWLNKNIFIFKAILATILAYAASIKLATIWQARKILLDKAEAFSINVIVGFLRILTGEIKIATIASKAMQLANPFVFFASAAIGATVAITGYMKKMRESVAEAKILLSKGITDMNVKFAESQKNAIISTSDANIKAANGDVKKLNEELKRLDDKMTKNRDVLKKYKEEVDKASNEKNTNQVEYQNDLSAQKQKRNKTPLEIKTDKSAYNDAVKANNAQVGLINSIAGQRSKLRDIIVESNNKIAASDKELTEKQKQLRAEQIDNQKKFNEEIAKLLNDVERAKIEAIEEENARELLFLQKDLKDKEAQINQEIDAQKKLAIELGKGTAVLKKLEEDRGFLLLGVREKYARDRAALIDKQKIETDETAYKKEIEALTQKFEVEKLLEKQLYAEGKSSKEKYDTQIRDLDRQNKVELLAIARKYGKSENEIQQAIADYDIAIYENRNERIKREMLNESELRLRVANNNLNQPNSGGKFNSDNLKEKYDAETNLLVNKLAIEQGITELNEQTIFNLKKQFAIDFAELETTLANERKDRNMQIADESINAFKSFFDTILSYRSEQIQQEIDLVNQQKDAELASLEDRKNKRLLNEDQYQNEKNKIQKRAADKERELKRKQAVQDKVAAVFNIGLSTAEAIMKTYAEYGATPIGIALAAAAGVVGALQIAFAASKPIPYAKGGKFLGDVMQGPTHADGGMPVINPTTGKVVAELEGGEPILSKKTYENNRDVVDSLLYVSQNENGRKIKLPNYYKSPPTFAYGGIIGAYQSTTMARAGNITNNYSTITESANNKALLIMVQKQGEMIDKFSKKLDEPLYGVWDYDYFQKSNAIIDRAKKIGNVG